MASHTASADSHATTRTSMLPWVNSLEAGHTGRARTARPPAGGGGGGQVLLDGINIAGLPSYQIARRGVGRTFQVSSEFPKLTVLENMLAAVQGVRGDSLRSALLGKRYWRSAEENNVRRAAELMDRFACRQWPTSGRPP
jgi:ABC-type uncharacterized transport system ATPase subunit